MPARDKSLTYVNLSSLNICANISSDRLSWRYDKIIDSNHGDGTASVRFQYPGVVEYYLFGDEHFLKFAGTSLSRPELLFANSDGQLDRHRGF